MLIATGSILFQVGGAHLSVRVADGEISIAISHYLTMISDDEQEWKCD